HVHDEGRQRVLGLGVSGGDGGREEGDGQDDSHSLLAYPRISTYPWSVWKPFERPREESARSPAGLPSSTCLICSADRCSSSASRSSRVARSRFAARPTWSCASRMTSGGAGGSRTRRATTGRRWRPPGPGLAA